MYSKEQYEQYLFGDLKFPKGFQFPKNFAKLIDNNYRLPDLGYWFVFTDLVCLPMSYMTLKKLYPKRNLIPFAKYGGNKMACFDGDDTSGDPKIFYIDNDAPMGSEDMGCAQNFDEWLDKAKKDSTVRKEYIQKSKNNYKKKISEYFKLPECFIKLIDSKDAFIDLDPWLFLFEDEKNFIFWHNKLKELYVERNLIPFAIRSCSDDIVCFDGNDNSGNPKVFYVHIFASAGWESRGYAKDFNEWLKLAKDESTEYKKGR